MKGIFVREDALVRRLAPGSQNSKQHPVVGCTELGVVALQGGPRHASVQESFYYLGPIVIGIVVDSGWWDKYVVNQICCESNILLLIWVL